MKKGLFAGAVLTGLLVAAKPQPAEAKMIENPNDWGFTKNGYQKTSDDVWQKCDSEDEDRMRVITVMDNDRNGMFSSGDTIIDQKDIKRYTPEGNAVVTTLTEFGTVTPGESQGMDGNVKYSIFSRSSHDYSAGKIPEQDSGTEK